MSNTLPKIKIIILSDLLIGSSRGVFPTNHQYSEPDGRIIVPSPAQIKLWDFVNAELNALEHEKALGRYGEVWTICLGHLLEPRRHNSNLLMTRDAAVIRQVATDVLSKFVALSDRFVGIVESDIALGRASSESEVVYSTLSCPSSFLIDSYPSLTANAAGTAMKLPSMVLEPNSPIRGVWAIPTPQN